MGCHLVSGQTKVVKMYRCGDTCLLFEVKEDHPTLLVAVFITPVLSDYGEMSMFK